MKHAPYHANPGNACALACYTMAAQYLLPKENLTFEGLGKIAKWKPGYVVWGFSLWKWLMDQGIHITDYCDANPTLWIKEGTAGLKKSVSAEQFNFCEENTFDLEAESKNVHLIFDHSNFTYIQRAPTWKDVVREHNKPGICDVTLNSRFLNNEEGYILHRVILLDITDTEVIFHDPNHDGSGRARHEELEHFKKAFKAANKPELCRYFLPG